MKNTNWKTIIAPIVATGVFEYETVKHVKVPQNVTEGITTALVVVAPLVVSIWGYFKNHRKVGTK